MKIDLYRIAARSALAHECVISAEESPHGCEKLRGLEHPKTHCMEHQGKHVKSPGAFCNDFVHEECGIPRESVQREKFASLRREDVFDCRCND